MKPELVVIPIANCPLEVCFMHTVNLNSGFIQTEENNSNNFKFI